jgi:penicillin amidase
MLFFHDLLGPVLKVGLTWLSRQRLPQIEGTVKLSGLSDPVEIIRDRWGIPHIYGTNLDDLFFAQGFVHAQDRLWQMELNRRTAMGRLSEIFGPLALETDRAVRTFGFNRLARTDWAGAGQTVRTMITAYTRGINAFLQNSSSHLPVEFSLLRFHPELWQPLDTMAFLRLMGWQFSHGWYSQIIRAQLIEAVGEGPAAELEIHYPENNPVTLPAGIEFNHINLAKKLPGVHDPFLDQNQGSNAWVVAGHKTTTGHTLLCNDIHLGIKLPAVWYELHLVAGTFNVTGVSLPGAPLVIVGHNNRIAWGVTLAFTDCDDLFVEKFDPQNPHCYQYQDQWLDAEVISEPIRIKGQTDPHVEQVVYTRHGPIISEMVGYPAQRLALSSMALQTPSPAKGWWLLNQAGNWTEFVEAMRLIEMPQLNMTYADVESNIGYWLTGKVPIRAKGQGLLPVPGWTGEYEWIGEVPFEEMPHAYNPNRGYLVTCNHRVISDDYPYFLGNVWMNGYRARRLVDVFESKDKLSVEDFRDLQLDVFCPPGYEFKAHLIDLDSHDLDVRFALEQLQHWDGHLTPDSIGGTLYEVTRYLLVRNLLEPVLGEALTIRLMGHGFNQVLSTSHEFYGHDTVSMLRMLANPNSWWLQQAGGRETVLERSLKQAVAWLRTHLGPDRKHWQWGRLHRVFFIHALGLRQPFDRVFNRGPWPIGGDTDTLCQTAISVHDPYDSKSWGPSYRQIIDLTDFSRSQAIYPLGQSGQLGSPHYDDMVEKWLKGEYHPMLWTRTEIEQAAEGRLILEPIRNIRMSQ